MTINLTKSIFFSSIVNNKFYLFTKKKKKKYFYTNSCFCINKKKISIKKSYNLELLKLNE